MFNIARNIDFTQGHQGQFSRYQKAQKECLYRRSRLVLELNFQHFNLNRGLQEEREQIPSQTTHSAVLMSFVTMAVIDEFWPLYCHMRFLSCLKTCKRLRHFSCSHTSLQCGHAAGNQPWWHHLQQTFFFWARNPCVL